MRGPRAKSISSRRTAAKHATRSGTAAVAPQSEFIVVESAPHRKAVFGPAEQQKALLLRLPAKGNNGEPEVNRQRRETEPPCGARRSTRNGDIKESKCIEVQENGRLTTPPPAIVFKSAPSPYKSNPFRLAVAIKVKYASKFTGAIVASRPRGCEYEYRYRSGSPG